jgi:protein O-GlcNAc transferase
MKSYDELKAEMEAIQQQMVEAKKNERANAPKKLKRLFKQLSFIAKILKGWAYRGQNKKINVEHLIEFIKPNSFKRHSLDKELIVSLTSYPKRFNILPITIQSLMNQSVKPDRIILWLYEKDFDYLPTSVSNLERFGLQILLIKEDWKSYKKIIPTLENFPNSYIITCDDDILYKPTLIEELVDFYQRVGGIVAQRAHIIQFESNGELAPYSNWLDKTPVTDFYETRSPLIFPTSGGGVLYPPSCFHENVIDIAKALELCPTADDVWLYFMASYSNSTFSLIGERRIIDLNQDPNDSLWSINSQGANDRQIKNMIDEFGMPRMLQRDINSCNKNSKQPNTVKLRNGRCLHVRDDHIGKLISQNKYYYEHDLIGFVKRHISPRRVVDVGSNIGNHAIGFGGHPDYQVLCFEPDPELSEIAKFNLEMNSIQYQLFNFGLGEKDELLSFIEAGSENTGVGHFDRNGQSEIELPVKRMDDCISNDFEVDLIKIDVGGFELDVLLGAVNTIEKNAPSLIIEHQNYDHFNDCKDIIHQLGYRPIKVFCRKPTFLYLRDENIIQSDTNQPSWVDRWSAFINTATQ